jgi:hypothetical protein
MNGGTQDDPNNEIAESFLQNKQQRDTKTGPHEAATLR